MSIKESVGPRPPEGKGWKAEWQALEVIASQLYYFTTLVGYYFTTSLPWEWNELEVMALAVALLMYVFALPRFFLLISSFLSAYFVYLSMYPLRLLLQVAAKRSPVQRIDSYISRMADAIQWKCEQGWDEDLATAYTLLRLRATPVGDALREASPRFAGATYAIFDSLTSRAAVMTEGEVAPDVYTHLSGPRWSLRTLDPEWLRLELPDHTGFRGFTTTSLFGGSSDPKVSASSASRSYCTAIVLLYYFTY